MFPGDSSVLTEPQAANPPTIKAAASFVGLGMISTDVYIEGGDGAEWYINQASLCPLL